MDSNQQALLCELYTSFVDKNLNHGQLASKCFETLLDLSPGNLKLVARIWEIHYLNKFIVDGLEKCIAYCPKLSSSFKEIMLKKISDSCEQEHDMFHLDDQTGLGTNFRNRWNDLYKSIVKMLRFPLKYESEGRNLDCNIVKQCLHLCGLLEKKELKNKLNRQKYGIVYVFRYFIAGLVNNDFEFNDDLCDCFVWRGFCLVSFWLLGRIHLAQSQYHLAWYYLQLVFQTTECDVVRNHIFNDLKNCLKQVFSDMYLGLLGEYDFEESCLKESYDDLVTEEDLVDEFREIPMDAYQLGQHF